MLSLFSSFLQKMRQKDNGNPSTEMDVLSGIFFVIIIDFHTKRKKKGGEVVGIFQ